MIPIYDFSKDDERSIPFKFIPLNQRSDYDTTKAHRHNYYEIFLFAQGGGSHEIDFENYGVDAMSIHFVSPGQVHKLMRSPQSFGSIILFSRDFYQVNAQAGYSLFDYLFLNGNAAGAPVLKLDAAEFEYIYGLSQTMGREHVSHAESAEIIRSYLHVFLLKCRQFYERSPTPTVKVTEPGFTEFVSLLEQQYRSHHAVSFYVAQLTISARKLTDVCIICCGKTPAELIRERLMLEARRLLLHSRYSVKEIAYFLGFEDPAYFNRFFRKHEECSAGVYRKEGIIVP